MSKLKGLQRYGQSVWLDYIRRSLITSGELKRMVEEDGVRGVTSNPTIFEKAIMGSNDYDDAIEEALRADTRIRGKDLFESLAIEDIRMAADILRPVYDDTNGLDGFVSIEVSPHLAHDTEGTIAEARRLWRTIERPNLMIKVPSALEGIPAIEALIGDGININVTLIFSIKHYEAVAKAYIKGLERSSSPGSLSSVASVFVSRVDTAVDRILEDIGTPEALRLRGKIAIANAKAVYKRFREVFYGEPFSALRNKGGRPQRPLWASTGTKNAAYSDVLYVEELIGPDTVNTMPPATLHAFRDHGKVKATLEKGVEEAERTLQRLDEVGIDLNEITEGLQKDGITSFSSSFDHLIESLREKRLMIEKKEPDRLVLRLGIYHGKVEKRLQEWKEKMVACRIWEKDPKIWFQGPVPEITDRLGWLNLPEKMAEDMDDIIDFVEGVKSEGIRYVLLLGMGGSSLAPEVFQSIFGNAPGYPELIVLDSTHPLKIRSVEERIDLDSTLFIVSSKSGTTLETLSLFRYFWHQMEVRLREPGRHFIAITDPGTSLESLAHKLSFRYTFLAPTDVGGRYSALSVFGLVPAALIGMDVKGLVDQALTMVEGCAFCVKEEENHGLPLGATLGELAQSGIDKVTLITSPSLDAFPAWLEQLIAESTGKDGRGIIPVAGEPVGLPGVYGNDRFFVYLFLKDEIDPHLEERLKGIEGAGYPSARICLNKKMELGQEFFRWEVAVATAGAVLGIHPFNQPDVQLSKELTRKVMEERKDTLDRDGGPLSVEQGELLVRGLRDLINQAREGDYLSIQAYIAPSGDSEVWLQKIRILMRDRLKMATTIGYGPRFLHSTGQLHKGGPNTGIFLQFLDEPDLDLPVPETDYTFSSLIHSQATGDYQALKRKGRRVLRINLGRDAIKGLKKVIELLQI